MIMVIAELEDGREKIFSKENKPLPFDLNNTKDKKILKDYKRMLIRDRKVCYNGDLTLIDVVSNFDKDDRVFVKNIKYKKYDENLEIPLRTFYIGDNIAWD